jgi:hypothetical protein
VEHNNFILHLEAFEDTSVTISGKQDIVKRNIF